MRIPTVCALVAGVVVLSSVHAESGGDPAPQYFVDVSVPSLDRATQLSADGFDVAGVDWKALTVGVVATGEQLERLRSYGWPVTIRTTDVATRSIAALSDYSDPQELSAFMDQVVAAYPGLAKKIVLRNLLFEQQKQYALLITKDVSVPNQRPSFILDAQHHAREVMTPEIAKDMIDYLTSRYATDSQVRRWVDSINIYVVPSVNPDGAMHVFTVQPFWRKNRHPSCPVDNNRNYLSGWASCGGSSTECSSEIFHGEAPGSEPETQGLLQLTSDVRPFFALSYHSYGELIMYPYGCSDPDERSAFDEVAFGLNAVLPNDSGALGQYAVGPVWSTIYLADGTSTDTQYGRFGAYAFTIEVNTSARGFQPDYAAWRNVTVQRQRAAWTYFLTKTLDGAQIRGTVVEAGTGLPLPANVSLEEVTFTHGELPRHADANGNYHLLVHSGGTYHLTASYPGYCTVTQAVTVGSGPATVNLALIRPGIPQGLAAVAAGDNAIDLSWLPVAGAEQYLVLRSLTLGGPYDLVATVPGTQTAFHDAPVSGIATFHYVVRAIQGCESESSVPAHAATTGACTVGPAFAGAASATNPALSTCTVNVSWPSAATRCGGSVRYSVYRAATAPFVPGPGNLVAAGLSETSFTDHDALLGGASYAYIVRSVDAGNGVDDGNMLAMSATPTGPYAVGIWSDDAGDTGTARLVPAPPWSVKPTGGRTGPKVYSTGIYPNSLCTTISTPPISLTTEAMLTFATKYDMETGSDGGIVEIARGPDFVDWTSLPVNYPDMLTSEAAACPLPIQTPNSVFSRSNQDPVYTSYLFKAQLGAYADSTVVIRWRLASDHSGLGMGWWVDDVSVKNAFIPGACVTGAASNPKEAGPDGGMQASRSAATGVELTYTPGCGALDHAVYWGSGTIMGAPVWSQSACGLGNSGQATFDPGDPGPDTLVYFVIVGQNAAKEGSYGAGTGGERPEATGIGVCDKPQDLTGTCP